MEPLKRRRAALRSAFTRVYNSVEDPVRNTPTSEAFDVNVLSSVDILRDKYDELRKLDEEILNVLAEDDDISPTDLDRELEGQDEYTGKYKLLVTVVSQHSAYLQQNRETGSSTSGVSQRKFKLPSLELKKFGGDIREWLSFWGQFRKIDEFPDIDEADKFQYLIQATLPQTRGREVVDSFPPIDGNYSKAIECLKARFGREDLLVEFYVRELLQVTLNMNSVDKKISLSVLYDKIETQLRALETLGVTSVKYAAMLFPLVESCLSEDILRAWQRSGHASSSQANGATRLQALMQFLRNEVENEERIAMAVQGFSLKGSKTRRANKESKNKSYLL